MANKLISALTELAESPAVDDELAIVDTSASTTKKVTTANLVNATNVATAGAVMTTGNVTISGTKTFQVFPITPLGAPTTDYQVANKKFVDDSIAAGGGYTDEMAQDAVGGTLTDTTTVDLTYDDANGQITADVKTGSVANSLLANMLQDTIKGRATASTGAPEDLSATQVRTIINVENGADVTDATNVASAGAVMEGDTTTASMSFVIDEDNMATNSATKVPTQQSVKAYVDTAITTVSGGGMENPMTTALDIIVGGVSGAAARLAKGTADQVLAMNGDASAIAWADPAAGSGGQTVYDAVVAATGGDYTTVKAAIDAGKRKMLIQGTVTETANLSYTGTIDNILIEGKDPEVDIIDFGWAYRADFLGASDNFINALTIRNVTIKDAKAEYENNDDYGGLRAQYIRDLIIENVTFLGSSERDRLPNSFKFCQTAIIRNCRVYGYRHGIRFGNTMSGNDYVCNCVIEGNTMIGYNYDSMAFFGIYASGDNTDSVWIRNNAIHNFGAGIISAHAIVEHNYIRDSRATSATGAGCIYANGGMVSNNFIKMGTNMAANGINMISEGIVSDNIIVSANTGNARVGIRNAYNSNSIVGNRIEGCSSYGISLTDDSDATVVMGNSIKSCANTIQIPTGADNNIVIHNILKGNTTNTITDAGTGNVPDPETENMFVA